MRTWAIAIAAAALAAAAGWAVRAFFVEWPQWAWACQVSAPPGWCPLRSAAVLALQAGVPGAAALPAGACALLLADRRWALAAIALGAAGLVLYAPPAGAAGLLLGGLALVEAARRARTVSSATVAANTTHTAAHPHA